MVNKISMNPQHLLVELNNQSPSSRDVGRGGSGSVWRSLQTSPHPLAGSQRRLCPAGPPGSGFPPPQLQVLLDWSPACSGQSVILAVIWAPSRPLPICPAQPHLLRCAEAQVHPTELAEACPRVERLGKAPHLGKAQVGFEATMLSRTPESSYGQCLSGTRIHSVVSMLSGHSPPPTSSESNSFPTYLTSKCSAGHNVCPHPSLSTQAQPCLLGCKTTDGTLSDHFTWVAARPQEICCNANSAKRGGGQEESGKETSMPQVVE